MPNTHFHPRQYCSLHAGPAGVRPIPVLVTNCDIRVELGTIASHFGERSLRRTALEFIAHYHQERNHQGLENRLIKPESQVGQVDGEIECRERLGGMLRYYYRRAA